jgi:hypothetical protein
MKVNQKSESITSNWQYLVLRGEMREELGKGVTVDANRKFADFREVECMSSVASHCRQAGLEWLFLTTLKIHANSAASKSNELPALPEQDDIPYGALMRVDHMNDGKAYRKWLRRTCNDIAVALLLKQCYLTQDFSKSRPLIVVGLNSVTAVLKKRRTSRVDVNSKGKPCLERMMTVLVEGELRLDLPTSLDWDDLCSESSVNTSTEKLDNHIQLAGIPARTEAIRDVCCG